jgi:uncharacterized protein YjbI with pentapeptide repeats
MPLKELATRWRGSAENYSAGERIFNVFKHGGVLTIDHSPFGRQEGELIDLRGYDASRVLVKNVTVRDVDLSYSNFSSAWLEGNRFENCVFIGGDFSDTSDHGSMFDRCVFAKCKFKLAALGYDGSQFRNCTFKESNFQRTNFIRAEFVNTEFLQCRLKGIDFNASSFENCNFEGLLNDVWFRGTFPLESDSQHFGQPKINKMLNVSFENAELRNLTFSNGCDLSSVKIKNNGRYFKYGNWYQRLRLLEKESATWSDENQKSNVARFVRVFSVHAQTQDWEILSLADLEEFYGGAHVAQRIVDCLNSYS